MESRRRLEQDGDGYGLEYVFSGQSTYAVLLLYCR